MSQKEYKYPRTVRYTTEKAKIGPSPLYDPPVPPDNFHVNLNEIFAFSTY